MGTLMKPVTDDDKIKELDREIMWRHRVYPKLIRAGKMRPEAATRQLQVMNAILEDYKERSALPLFNVRKD